MEMMAIPIVALLGGTYLVSAANARLNQDTPRERIHESITNEAIVSTRPGKKASLLNTTPGDTGYFPAYAPVDNRRAQLAHYRKQRGHDVAIYGSRPLSDYIKNLNPDSYHQWNFDQIHQDDIMKELRYRLTFDESEIYTPYATNALRLPWRQMHPQLGYRSFTD